MIGIDEVGRGAWAGPLLVVAARQLAELPNGLTDSKQTTKKQREKMFSCLSLTCEIGEGWVTANEIDHHGLAEAMRLGVARALGKLNILPLEEIIMDGTVDYLPDFVKGQSSHTLEAKADAKYPIVSAASVTAKVLRDRFMTRLGIKHPGYGFEKHVGYGTPAHRLALQTHGAVRDVHRFSFAPVKAAL